jgi:hypothetical protein
MSPDRAAVIQAGGRRPFSSERKALDYQDGCINASEFNMLML